MLELNKLWLFLAFFVVVSSYKKFTGIQKADTLASFFYVRLMHSFLH